MLSEHASQGDTSIGGKRVITDLLPATGIGMTSRSLIGVPHFYAPVRRRRGDACAIGTEGNIHDVAMVPLEVRT